MGVRVFLSTGVSVDLQNITPQEFSNILELNGPDHWIRLADDAGLSHGFKLKLVVEYARMVVPPIAPGAKVLRLVAPSEGQPDTTPGEEFPQVLEGPPPTAS